MSKEKGDLSFLEWFQTLGDQLLRGWLRARQDGNEEPFGDWVTAEYDWYVEDGEQYEIPYFGMFDKVSDAELAIYTV